MRNIAVLLLLVLLICKNEVADASVCKFMDIPLLSKAANEALKANFSRVDEVSGDRRQKCSIVEDAGNNHYRETVGDNDKFTTRRVFMRTVQVEAVKRNVVKESVDASFVTLKAVYGQAVDNWLYYYLNDDELCRKSLK
ncbi:hypothetical protein Tcan_03612 [Toxocara canis]|uniref:Uncharacterized protein n=1 Tax=Toxocara canis TaxID=6265 RepID=A0A0B2V4B8_TOXCA|nr:hypothetical protein Tcan_03612 [Toxocara canis]